jgi:hypothetical protein
VHHPASLQARSGPGGQRLGGNAATRPDHTRCSKPRRGRRGARCVRGGFRALAARYLDEPRDSRQDLQSACRQRGWSAWDSRESGEDVGGRRGGRSRNLHDLVTKLDAVGHELHKPRELRQHGARGSAGARPQGLGWPVVCWEAAACGLARLATLAMQARARGAGQATPSKVCREGCAEGTGGKVPGAPALRR